MTTMPQQLWVYRAKVERVVDGDTIDVVIDLGLYCYATHRLRLLGVNTPEARGPTRPAGVAAKFYTVEWLPTPGTNEWGLIVQTEKSDAFGRFLAWVWRVSDGRCLNSDLLESENAAPFDG